MGPGQAEIEEAPQGDVQCSSCGHRAVEHLAYAGRSLCRVHFIRLFETRFKRELRAQLTASHLTGGGAIAVGLSGGKDSVTLVTLLARFLGRNPRFRIVPVCVDEGIPGYRERTLARARDVCAGLGLEPVLVAHEDEHGATTQDLVEARPDARPCAACGVMRRSSLNRAATRLGADALATGHNLDDMAETVLMNLGRGSLDSLLRMAPHVASPDGLVPRLAPLRTSTEREVALYAILKGLPYSDAECPHAVDATRGAHRAVLLQMLERDPGVRHALLAVADDIKRRVQPMHRAPLGRCERCGDPAVARLCRACEVALLVYAAGGSPP